MKRLTSVSPDVYAVLLLVLLWGVFFWRLLTPVSADQVSFRQGDFSGQFVTFGAYQYDRFTHGDIPLWNPYNNGGFPFIADTQSAVFYPPRLLTIAISYWTGGWHYNALQMEAIFHVLLYSLLVYLLIRRLTMGSIGSLFGAIAGAIIASYGGFISGYPPLQLALLEAGIWLPLVILGILEATRSQRLAHWGLVLAGFALGLSWLAGHPQTSWFCTVLALAWFAYRTYVQKIGWRSYVGGVLLLGGITLGVTAVTFLPSVEYLRYTTRSELGFDAKSNGFPFQDLLQFVYPYSVSLFSPLYVGIPALLLGCLALLKRPEARFWGIVALLALLLSFGKNSVFYQLLYQIPSGLSFFRGQERAAYLVSFALAVLAAYGMVTLTAWQTHQPAGLFRRFLWGLLMAVLSFSALICIAWLGFRDEFGAIVGIAVFSAIILIATVGLIFQQLAQPKSLIISVMCGLIVFELFSTNMAIAGTYDHRPSSQQLDFSPLSEVAIIRQDTQAPVRVDGFRGLRDNYGSLYQIMDIRGISPLFLTSAQKIIYQDYVNNPLAWELFAVKYVFSERDRFGHTPTQVIAQTSDKDGTVYLHQLDNPRPFAQLVYHYDLVDSDTFAQALLHDPAYNPRESVIVSQQPTLDMPTTAPKSATTSVTQYAPESFTVVVNTPTNAMLSLAQVDYVGWHATLDGTSTRIYRAYGALSAVEVPRGQHTIVFTYDPLSFKLGALFSLFTWAGLTILILSWAIRQRPKGAV